MFPELNRGGHAEYPEMGGPALGVPRPIDTEPPVDIVRTDLAGPSWDRDGRDFVAPIVASDDRRAVPPEGGHATDLSQQVKDIPIATAETAAAADIPGTPPDTRFGAPAVNRALGIAPADTTFSERHPNLPKVVVHFHFGSHEEAENFAAVPGLLREADVYTFENTTGPTGVDSFTWLAGLDVEPGSAVVEDIIDAGSLSLPSGKSRPLRGTPNEMMVRGVTGTGIAVGYFDATVGPGPEDSRSTYAHSIKEDFANTLQGVHQDNKRSHAFVAGRDAAMLGPHAGGEVPPAGNFEDEMVLQIGTRPDLARKEVVRVVDTHGSLHSSIFHRARAAGVPAERSFETMPYVYSHGPEVTRTIAFGKEPSPELLAKAFVDDAIRNTLSNRIKTTADETNFDYSPSSMRYRRAITDKFTMKDAERVFDARKAGQSPLLTINQILSEKGQGPLAESRDEIDAYVAAADREAAQRKQQILERRGN